MLLSLLLLLLLLLPPLHFFFLLLDFFLPRLIWDSQLLGLARAKALVAESASSPPFLDYIPFRLLPHSFSLLLAGSDTVSPHPP
ncbi:hypothetical protein ASPCADRAFT_204989 [Aspergillus carbonarius ITEM 5010]|uniref:Uncharacterized protein n=1 Tax=Aspergillus carbonarius (strain ITEM 5010) TaxID=602072 RepID=A0A1R3RTD2_ASPC5|nr:hypothetical protein ASPCADRAFT_204989 [Aspergillus carbonarius ITEM 5010]